MLEGQQEFGTRRWDDTLTFRNPSGFRGIRRGSIDASGVHLGRAQPPIPRLGLHMAQPIRAGKLTSILEHCSKAKLFFC